MSEVVHHAKQPDYAEILTQLELGELTRSNMENSAIERQRYSPPPVCKECEADLDVGFFFDGTDNNKERDWGPDDDNPLPFLQRKHSNVVRLFHAFPDELDRKKNRFTIGTRNRSYRYYIPGVGTEFDKVGDNGKGKYATMGSATGLGGEARIIWALFQVVNAINMFFTNKPLVEDVEIQTLLNGMNAKVESTTANVFKELATRYSPFPTTVKSGNKQYEIKSGDDGRIKILKDKFNALRAYTRNKMQEPKLRRVNLHVFGFSRGAAEARAFVNYLLQLRDNTQSVLLPGEPDGFDIGGAKIKIQFMGIFDTVASVGAAGLYSFSEGRSAWADGTMEISPRKVGRCVHMVAAHETRACFPLDSVRVGEKYPGNCEEIVYPGSHSDVGGGYYHRSLGKDDWLRPADSMQLSKVTCFDMYCRALTAGVPFYTLEQLKEQGAIGQEYAKDLQPERSTVIALQEYKKDSGVQGGPVEDQLWAHFGHYLGWRWEQGKNYFLSWENMQEEIKRSNKELEDNKKALEKNLAKQEKLAKKGSLLEKITGPNLSKHVSINEDGTVESSEEMKRLLKERERLLVDKRRIEQDLLDHKRTVQRLDEGTLGPGEEIARLNEDDSAQALDGRGNANEEISYLEKTQRAILQVTAAYCEEIDRRIGLLRLRGNMPNMDESCMMPLNNTLSLFSGEKFAGWTDENMEKARNMVVQSYIGRSFSPANRVFMLETVAKFVTDRATLLKTNFHENAALSMKAVDYLNKWRKELKDYQYPEQHNEVAPEREPLWLLGALEEWSKLTPDKRNFMGKFFGDLVRDSEAGFIGKGMLEFELNGYGIAKFRRIFFGNSGDLYTRVKTIERNKVQRGIYKGPYYASRDGTTHPVSDDLSPKVA